MLEAHQIGLYHKSPVGVCQPNFSCPGRFLKGQEPGLSHFVVAAMGPGTATNSSNWIADGVGRKQRALASRTFGCTFTKACTSHQTASHTTLPGRFLIWIMRTQLAASVQWQILTRLAETMHLAPTHYVGLDLESVRRCY